MNEITGGTDLSSSFFSDRNVKAENTGVIDNILHSMLHRGFINYYGMQRFGTASVSTHTVGLALLKSQWKEACEMLLARRQGEHPDVDQARQCWEQTGDAGKTLELMPRRNTAERALLEFWARPNQDKTNYYGALLNVSVESGRVVCRYSRRCSSFTDTEPFIPPADP
jgi:tRNA pseudouridine13 synthase